ncbi:MAG: hypothetical protein IJX68_08690 [Rikenellaceae bacterium]|nr:hypothetical protein [Rikenellaceae bacterium]
MITAAGEENVIETVQRNGVALTVNNKTVNIEVPTDADIQSLITAYGYQTASDVDDAITDALAGITGIEFEIVQELPATGETGTIYLLSNSGASPNVYDEYIYVNDAFEKIGTTEVDLSGYVQASEMHALTNAEIDTVFNQVFGS